MSGEPEYTECLWPPFCPYRGVGTVPLCPSHMAVVLDRYREWRSAQRWRGHVFPPELREIEEPEPHVAVYYLRLPHGNIKIGSSMHPFDRARQLRVDPANILAIEPGGRARERQRHKEFAKHRIGRTEDFTPAEVLMQHIAAIRETFGDPAQLDRDICAANEEAVRNAWDDLHAKRCRLSCNDTPRVTVA